MKTYTADWERVASQVRLVRPTYEVRQDEVSGSLIHNLEGFILAGAPQEFWVSRYLPAGRWQMFLWLITENPRTRLGHWVRKKIEPRMTLVRAMRTINRRICPHGVVEADPAKHLEFLVQDDLGYFYE